MTALTSSRGAFPDREGSDTSAGSLTCPSHHSWALQLHFVPHQIFLAPLDSPTQVGMTSPDTPLMKKLRIWTPQTRCLFPEPKLFVRFLKGGNWCPNSSPALKAAPPEPQDAPPTHGHLLCPQQSPPRTPFSMPFLTWSFDMTSSH